MSAIILALDTPDVASGMRVVDRLPDLEWVKVGPTLLLREGGGPSLIRQLLDRDLQVFLDLKWHDIPHQVAGAVRAARDLGVDLVTVHALGGVEMVEAAVEAAGSMRVAAVSVLTSHTGASLARACGRQGPVPTEDEVRRLVRMALEAGVGAVVCSPAEVGAVREVTGPDPWVVVPGIRAPGAGADDQRRTGDAGTAARAGATHLVVGRPIWRAESPELVYTRLCDAVEEDT